MFPPQATTGTAPITVLTGPASKVTRPGGLVVLGDGSVVLANQSRLSPFSNDSVTTHAPLVGGAPPVVEPVVSPPGTVGRLRVAGAKDAAKRKVTWQAPSSNGGEPVTGYKVVVTKGKKVLTTKSVKGLSLQLKKAKLPAGRLKVTVSAQNSKGFGAGVTVSFKVAK